jgi:hypothetical protein
MKKIYLLIGYEFRLAKYEIFQEHEFLKKTTTKEQGAEPNNLRNLSSINILPSDLK